MVRLHPREPIYALQSDQVEKRQGAGDVTERREFQGDDADEGQEADAPFARHRTQSLI